MALIDQLKIANEDKLMIKQNVKELLKVRKNQDELSKEQIRRHFAEWKAIAERISKGTIMLDSLTPVREDKKEYVDDLYELYVFMLKLLGMYDLFFQEMLQSDDHIRRSKNVILLTISGKEVQ